MAELKLPQALAWPASWLSRKWIGLTSFALLVLLCWLLANWTWIFWPRPKVAQSVAGQEVAMAAPPSVGEIVARHFPGLVKSGDCAAVLAALAD